MKCRRKGLHLRIIPGADMFLKKNQITCILIVLNCWRISKTPESQNYIKFLEENGVECVATYMRWVYLRKKSSEGPFDIYSDNDSKLSHFKRMNLWWRTIVWIEIIAGGMNATIAIAGYMGYIETESNHFVNLIGGLVLIGFGLLFYVLGGKTRQKIRELKREIAIRE